MNHALDEVLQDAYFGKWVDHYARKLSWRFRQDMGFEDAKQELWEAVVVRLNGELVDKPPRECAKSAAYSKYGHLVEFHSRRAQYRTNECADDAVIESVPSPCPEYAIIEANDTLDRVQVRVRTAKKSRTKEYRAVATWLRLARKGYTQNECARAMGVDPGYLRTARHRVFRQGPLRAILFEN